MLLLPKSGYTGDNFKFLPTTEIPLHTYRMILINLDTYPERINASNFLKRFFVRMVLVLYLKSILYRTREILIIMIRYNITVKERLIYWNNSNVNIFL